MLLFIWHWQFLMLQQINFMQCVALLWDRDITAHSFLHVPIRWLLSLLLWYIVCQTRNTFCGTLCLPHCRIHNHWMAIFLLPVWNLTLPSGSSTPIFCKMYFGDSQTFEADIGCIDFRTSSSKIGGFRSKIGEEVMQTRSYFWGLSRLCHIWWKSIKTLWTHALTCTDAKWFYNQFHAIAQNWL